jgi:hypothetical protein
MPNQNRSEGIFHLTFAIKFKITFDAKEEKSFFRYRVSGKHLKTEVVPREVSRNQKMKNKMKPRYY